MNRKWEKHQLHNKKMWEQRELRRNMRQIRNYLWALAKGQCWYCARIMALPEALPLNSHREDMATLDHRVPISRGGTNDYDNFRLCCRKCNGAKADMTEDEFIESLESFTYTTKTGILGE